MKYKIQIAIAVIVTMFLASCDENKPEKKTEVPASKAAEYKTMELSTRPISGNLRLPGVLQPYQFVQLFPRISGFVKTVCVDRGTVVRKGQVLITLEAPEIEQQVAQAKLKFTQAEATYIISKDRYRRLLETSNTPGTISSFDLAAAASKMRGDSATAQGEYANYKAQETMKSYLVIAAPFDGVITERNVHPGALAGPGAQNAKPMLVLQQSSMLRLVVDIPEQYAAQVKNGDKVSYKINALPGQDFSGLISRSSQSLGSTYRSEAVEIDVRNADDKLKPGMYTEVLIPTSGSTNAFVVPRSAVVTTTERKYVIAARDGRSEWVDVSEGNQSNDSVEIFGRLHSSDKIITNPSYRIKEGDKVSF